VKLKIFPKMFWGMGPERAAGKSVNGCTCIWRGCCWKGSVLLELFCDSGVLCLVKCKGPVLGVSWIGVLSR